MQHVTVHALMMSTFKTILYAQDHGRPGNFFYDYLMLFALCIYGLLRLPFQVCETFMN